MQLLPKMLTSMCGALNPHILLDECAVSDPLLHLRFFFQFSRLVHIDGWRFDTLHILENQDMGGWVAYLAMWEEEALSPLFFLAVQLGCCSLLNNLASHSHDALILSSFLLHSYCVCLCFFLSRGSTQKQPPILTSWCAAKNSNEKSEISVRQVKGAFSLPAALYATSFVDLWRAAAHVAGAVGTADHNKFRGWGGLSCQRNAWEYPIHSMSHSHASSPSTQSSLHSPSLSSESIFFPLKFVT